RRAARLSPGAGARRLEQGVCLLPQASRCDGRGSRGLTFEGIPMCSYIVEKAKLLGSATGPNGRVRVHPPNAHPLPPFHARHAHARLALALAATLAGRASGGRDPLAVERTAPPARGVLGKPPPAWAGGEVERGRAAPPPAARAAAK